MLRASDQLRDPLLWVELFIVGNIGFLAVDIGLAHTVNAFADRAEWYPIWFSVVATPLLILGLAAGGAWTGRGEAQGMAPRLGRVLGLLIGWGAIAVGVAGLLFHLDSQFFQLRTLSSLVYTAPFAAPLAYAGVGLLLILDRMVPAREAEWGRWVVLLAAGGFMGNFVLTLCDHAQNGFFNGSEWIGVAASAIGVGALVAVVTMPEDRPLRWLAAGLMVAQVAVGVLGMVLHVRANLASPMATLWERFLYGAPVFAPLLFADLALLALLGLWALERSTTSPTTALVVTSSSAR